MPGFKQPRRLERIAFDYLLKSVVGYCDKLSIDGTLSQLREGVSFVKNNVIANLPVASFPEFIKKFFYKFYRIGLRRSNFRPDSHCRAILELTMDVDVVGLRCGGDILRHLSPRDAHRFRGLKVLDFSGFWENTPRRLENFCLEELTIFILPRFCTDLDLEVIGSRCPKLQVLDIEESVKVTDRGLSFLNSCTELRVANLRFCTVSDKGINELLSLHNQLEEFNVGRYYTRGEKGFDILSRKVSDVCPSVKRFSIKSSPVTDAHLSSIVKIFPNLIHIRICCQVTGDLRALKDLRKLRELNFSYGYRCFRMTNLKELLLIVGENLHVLNIHHCFPSVSVTQNDLDYIFQFCANLEYLEFDYEPDAITENLVIPSFKKLKTLKCTALDKSGVLLEFSKILELETLVIHGFDGVFQLTESMMLDHVNFPKLKEIRTFYNSEENANRIAKIARHKNLDFLFKFEQ